MNDKIIKYFKDNLRKKLKRPNCGRYLPLWDDKQWRNNGINIPSINSNDFLVFFYQTKSDLCCIQNNNGQILSNAIDKFFYVLFDLETYFNIFIANNIYQSRAEILNDIIKVVQFKCAPPRLNYNYREIFNDLVKRTNEWNYWKRLIIVAFTKILLTEFSYDYAQRNASDFLQELINNVEQLFHKGMEN